MLLAVFVDGEFWHGKKLSAERLAEISEYWQRKIARNLQRDERTNDSLRLAGWSVLRVGTKTVAAHRRLASHQRNSLRLPSLTPYPGHGDKNICSNHRLLRDPRQ